jgi:serine/threonine protein kinase
MISAAIAHLHSIRLEHNDIKASNIMFPTESSENVILVDFDSCAVLDGPLPAKRGFRRFRDRGTCEISLRGSGKVGDMLRGEGLKIFHRIHHQFEVSILELRIVRVLNTTSKENNIPAYPILSSCGAGQSSARPPNSCKSHSVNAIANPTVYGRYCVFEAPI